MAKSRKKYYAIKKGKGIENKIVTSWAECEKLVKGCHSLYKGFKRKDEALQYLEVVNVEVALEKVKKGMEHTKKFKATTKTIPAMRLDKELVEQFNKKCKDMDITDKQAIESLLKEWVLD